MSITYKTKEDIARICESGAILGAILEDTAKRVSPGVDTLDLDAYAENCIRSAGGAPAFKGYRHGGAGGAYPATLCVSVNDVVVHGIPQKGVVLQEGDIVSLDIGMQWPVGKSKIRGVFTDTALSVPVGKISKDDTLLLERTYAALLVGIKAAQLGKSVANIGKKIEQNLEPFSYGIVRDLCGHGVGYAVHEEPNVPNYFEPYLQNIKLVSGLVIAIEPMITRGTYRVVTDADSWTIRTADGSRAAHFEHTIIITPDGPIVATKRPNESF